MRSSSSNRVGRVLLMASVDGYLYVIYIPSVVVVGVCLQ